MNLSDHERAALLEWFEQCDPPHGTVFDDNRRWCGTCERPQRMVAEDPERPLLHAVCPTCRAIWPEFVLELAEAIEEDGVDSLDYLEPFTNH